MKIDPLTATGLVIAVGSAGMSAMSPERSTITSTATHSTTSAVFREVESEAITIQSQLAATRYQSGLCLTAANPIGPNQIVTNIAVGSYVCDRFGTTAIVAPGGDLVQIARTGDPKIITEGLK